jgi:hypothetical protein
MMLQNIYFCSYTNANQHENYSAQLAFAIHHQLCKSG